MKDFKEGRIGKGNYDSVAFIRFSKKGSFFGCEYPLVCYLFIGFILSFEGRKFDLRAGLSVLRGSCEEPEDQKGKKWVSRRFSLVLGSEF